VIVKRTKTKIASPMIENSSRRTEKMKSVCRSGRKARRREVVDAVLEAVCMTI